MTHSDDATSPETGQSRAAMALIGALAGVLIWAIGELLDSHVPDRMLFLALAGTGNGFAILLAMAGPVPLRRAWGAALGLAALVTGLLFWASLRFDSSHGFLESGHVVAAWVVLAAIPVPFVIAHLRPGEHWRDYAQLFDHAWQIVVRYGAAWIFTGLFWGLLFLSDAVLQIVGLPLIEKLIDLDPVPWLLTGGALGLALAVVHELRAFISPMLVLRLLRLLLPLVLVVTALFVLAAPLQGLSKLFGGISAAGTLMAMAVAAATLVTTALDRAPAQAATARGLVLSARAMALLLPILGALASWAIWLRVAQYGWTPARVAAATGAAVVLAYGVAYGLAALRVDWAARIRRANVTLALGLVALAALWLSPVLNPERIATQSQMSRFSAAKLSVEDLPLWELKHDWGRAGQIALARLREMEHPDRGALERRLAKLDDADSRYRFVTDRVREVTLSDLLAQLPVLPEGVDLPRAFLSNRSAHGWRQDHKFDDMRDGCARPTPGGRPGCLAVVADFLPTIEGEEVLFLWTGPNRRGVRFAGFAQTSDAASVARFAPLKAEDHNSELIDLLHDSPLFLEPLPAQGLRLGDTYLGLYP